MGSLSGTWEIVEATEELNSGNKTGKNQKLPELKLGYKDNIDDDINKLFESISQKTSRDLSLLQDGTSPKMKNALKKPITVGVARSPRIGTSEPVTLKQALRDLCISKASEMAAIKRLSKSTSSPRVSEVGKIKTLYNAVVAEPSRAGLSFVESKGTVYEVSLVSEESKSVSLMETSHYCQTEVGKINTLQNSAVAEACQPGPSCVESKGDIVETSPVPEEIKAISSEKTSQTCQNAKIISTSEKVHQSPKLAIPTTQNDAEASMVQSNLVYSSTKFDVQLQRMETSQTEKQDSAHSLPVSGTNASKLELPENTSSKKLGNKALVSKNGRKGRSQTVSSSSNSVNVNRSSKLSRSTPRTVKSVIRNKNLSKKKLKQDSSSVLSALTSNEMNNKSVPGQTQLICQRCRCTLENTSNGGSQESIASESTSPGDGVDSSNVHAGGNNPVLTSTNCNRSRAVAKVKKTTRLREQLEFSQSSKSSQGEYSSSTSTSDDSNVSGSTCGNRPHMSKDVRWEAIRHACMQHGVLGLRHFNLLKKLGCGDIGTVYLAELIGTNCLFAIKVMDNEFLARRKKMPRAQTEREILRMLDHPFLPTLYAQFTSDNLSCLVMEYCPGGDLHVLRQKQLGRSFSEPAARFYVAEVLLALEYLHMLGVVYRDLKPENILVREDGHIMLTDFDLSFRCAVSPTLLKSSSDVDPAKISGPYTRSSCIEPFCIEPSCQVPCFSPRFLPASAKARKLKTDLAAHVRSLPQLVAEPTDARSNSFVGTHEYLAPEIIKGEGHGAAVDWWTFGVFLYELLYGRTPFKGCNNEETLANVVLQGLRFPDSPFVSFQARDLIRGLLVKEPENRLGSEKGAAEIKQHPFFEGLNWALIRCAIPPELPDFCDFGISELTQQGKGKYLECNATGDHVEFELF
ncbi:hypothetical protein L6164_033818 [Bauhinia variegata]|uniref:Uncharacterized protein n=1 Tax=Bauhinia variegata TaxID=167791 RepID=A0ACB9KTC1_BAUVA|nr:hypothetical protein L6164_033818 [Bauhinia variegata]